MIAQYRVRLAALLACLFFLGPVPFAASRAADAPVRASGASVLVQESTVQERILDELMHVYGQVQPDPARAHALTALGETIVRKVSVAPGQRVAAEQPLLVLEAGPALHQSYLQAVAQLNSTRAALVQTQALYRQQLATRAQLAQAKGTEASAQAALSALRAQGAAAGAYVLRAPEAAIVTRNDVVPGALVQAGQPLLVLAAQDALQVRLGLNPQEARRVRPGMLVQLEPVFGGKPISARVTYVDAAVNPSTHLIDAVVHLSGEQAAALATGAWMKGKIQLSAQRALAVPRSAVLTDAQGTYVFLVADGHARRVPVQAGVVHDGWIAVRGALAVGQRVVTAGNYELRNGMAVRTTMEPAR